MTATGHKFLTVDDIAGRLSVDASNVRRWIKEGRLRAFDVSRKQGSRKPRLRVEPADLETFLASRATLPVTSPRRPRRSIEPDVIRFSEMM